MKRAAIISVLFLAMGCSSKKELDTAAEGLLSAYRAGDYQAFVSKVHPEIAKQIPEETFANASKAIAALGEPLERSMHGISVKSGGPSEGSYTLKYPDGEVQFKLKVLKGTVVSFNIEGELLTQAMRKEVTKEFKVSSFSFLEKKDGPPKVGSTFAVGQEIPFRLRVLGLTEMDGKMHLGLHMAVLLPDNTLAFEKKLIDQAVPLEKDALPIANPSGSFTIPKPNTYRLKLTVADVFGKRTQVIEQAFTVETPK
jgi:hypothetical protein